MIDLHCHLLPGIDDGASDQADSLAMLQAAFDEGIRTIVATAHYNNKYNNEKLCILNKVQELQLLANAKQMDIEIVPGQEVLVYGKLIEDYQAGKLLTIGNGSRYMLVEFSSGHVPHYAGQLLYNMELQGLKPVIVHPERNAGIMENPDRLYKLVEKGALTQITASSIIGRFGKKVQRFTYELIEAHLVHVIASDAHDIASRGFGMRRAFREIKARYGSDCVKYFQENAQSIINNQIIYPEQPEHVIKKKFLGIFK